jgi:hypothetical protein
MMLEHLAVILKSARHRAHAWRVIFFQPPVGGSILDVVEDQIRRNAKREELFLTK